MIVYDPAITLAIATQPEMLRTLAGKPGAAGRGVLARPLYVLPAPVYREGLTPAADPAVLDEYARRIRSVYEDTPELGFDDDDHPRPTLLTFTAAARTVFEPFERELLQERRELGGDGLDGDAALPRLAVEARRPDRAARRRPARRRELDGRLRRRPARDRRGDRRARGRARPLLPRARARVFGLMGELPEQRARGAILGWLRAPRRRRARS